MKKIFEGQESSGKTLMLAREARRVLHRNAHWLKQTGVPRPIYTNLRFSDSFVALAKKKGIPIVEWQNLRDVVGGREFDLFIDEIGTYFDSRLWPDLSLDTRRWLAQSAKRGVWFYGTCQDFSQVDKAFRLLTTELIFVNKMFGSPRPMETRPLVKSVWGLGTRYRYDPLQYKDGDRGKPISIFPSFFLIRRRDTALFDTHQTQVKSKPLPLEHIERICDDCGKKVLRHV